MFNRYYDPATGHQFLSVDPAIAMTQAPYSYAKDDPVNDVDPSGLYPGEGLVHDALDVVAVPVYAVYYGSYTFGKAITDVGCSAGAIGCDVSRALVAVSPIPRLEAAGLGGDAALDWAKNKVTGNGESIFDEDICGGLLPRFIDGGGPRVWLPGLSYDRRTGAAHIDFAW